MFSSYERGSLELHTKVVDHIEVFSICAGKFGNICSVIPDHMKNILVSRIEGSTIRLINMGCCMKVRE